MLHFKIELNIWVWVKLKKNWIELKINSKGITNLHVKHSTIKLLEDNIRENVGNLGFHYDLRYSNQNTIHQRKYW